jgi:hypothetical protein
VTRSADKTVPCDAATRAARRAKAQEFLDAAQQLDGQPTAYVSLCVLAGIAAADVVCCARLGVHASGSDHSQAVALLAAVNTSAASALQRLLAMKNKSDYSSRAPSATEATRALRAAQQLLEAAVGAG